MVIKSSITRKLLVTTFSIYLLLTITVTMIHFGGEYLYTKKSILRELDVIQATFKPALKKAIWDINEMQLNSILIGMVELPQITGIKVISENGTNLGMMGIVIDALGNTIYIDQNHNTSLIEKKNLLAYHFDIEHYRNGEVYKLGKATLYSSSDIVLNRVAVGFLFVIVNAVIKTLALWLLFLWIGRRILTKPLKRLTEAVNQIQLDKVEHQKIDLNIKEQNELYLLEVSFNAMVESLFRSRQSLHQIQSNLEDLVEKRTNEIERVNKELQKKNSELQAMFNAFPDIYLWLNAKGTIIGYQAGIKSELYLPPEAFMGKQLKEIVPENVSPLLHAAIQKIKKGQNLVSVEYELSVGGVVKHFEARHLPLLEDQIIIIVRDITERKKADEHLKNSLKEKEVLLREIHHRVKNNLQMIQSLLSLQADKILRPDLKQPFIDSTNRIKSMALIHEALYRSEDMADLDIKAYFGNVTAHLFRIYQKPDQKITLTLHIDPIQLNLDQLIDCGLIINELVSNALKYAFKDDLDGHLEISLDRVDHKARLQIGDNGCGLPEEFNVKLNHSLGLRIVKIIAEGQLAGDLTIENKGGALFKIRFPLVRV